jgi:ADP-heptose:LPS heptosyltransferase
MDHIVSVDTAAIHLAGAMGHPSAHLLVPYLSDWRWHRTELWYPQLKTYRQTEASDWSAPFAQLNEALPCISTPRPG